VKRFKSLAAMTIVTSLLLGPGTGWSGEEGMEVDWKCFASPECAQVSFVDMLIAITDKASVDLFGVPVDRQGMRRYFKDLAWKVRLGTSDDIASTAAAGTARKAAAEIARVVFGEERFVPDLNFAARAEADTAVLSAVITGRRGVCLSLALIYLAVADEASVPLKGVSVPGHFFVRYEDGPDRLNLEMLDRGTVSRSNAFYRKKFFVYPDEPFYLKNLTQRESLAVYVSQLAAIYTGAGKEDEAIVLLEVARRASPSDPEISTNLGIALRAAGRADDALEAWKRSIVLDEYDDVAHFNLARGLAERGDWLSAIYHLDESMRLGHDVDMNLLRLLEPHRPDVLHEKQS
jgi:regulator of sirC expression with transglutaminase-like and TPR domain